jgi:phospholipase C
MSDKLEEIDHIVVLMLENRSFDHLLGYLRLEGGRDDVDGLDGTQSNIYNHTSFSPEVLSDTVFEPDPHHDNISVEEQLGKNNGGFIENYSKVEDCEDPQRIMNYHNASSVPVYDNLAEQFCISDRWFCSVQGQTQPNRIFAYAGHSNGKKDNLTKLELAVSRWDVKTIFDFLPEKYSWKFYSHDIASLRFVDRHKFNVIEIDKIGYFFEDVKNGELPNVSWIDPHFDIGYYYSPPNDDHPPHDLYHGQNLVRSIYNALVNGPPKQWKKTLFIIVYDEHGGFYDHVVPGECIDDREDFRQYGVRVPAIVVSPWVGKGVCFGSQQDVVFDHTSILKTILLRFCPRADGTIPHMSARVDAATDLGILLTEPAARNDCSPAPEMPIKFTFEDKFLRFDTITVKYGIEEHRLVPREPSELQESLKELADQAMAGGVPPEKL